MMPQRLSHWKHSLRVRVVGDLATVVTRLKSNLTNATRRPRSRSSEKEPEPETTGSSQKRSKQTTQT
jgi:hypothetical protein